MNEITTKNKLGQLLCRHKNTGWYGKESKFKCISGETAYKICKDCGKELDKIFREYQGMGYK